MAGAYQQVIGNATAAYNATLQGYQNTLRQQQEAQQGVMAGYNQLQANVLKGLEGNSAAARQEIIDQYTQQAGKQQMSLIGRGLGNTTILDSTLRGLGYDQAKAQTSRLNQFANTAAGYQTQLGLAGLGYAGNALNANMQFAGQGLQYQGQGAHQLGQLGLGFAGLDQQAQMQKDAFANQQRLAGGRGGGGGNVYGLSSGPSLGLNSNFGNNSGSLGPRLSGGGYDPLVNNPLARQQSAYGGPPQTTYGYGAAQGGGNLWDSNTSWDQYAAAQGVGQGGQAADSWAGWTEGEGGWWDPPGSYDA